MIKDHFPDYWLHPEVSEYQSEVITVKSNTFSLRDPFPFFIEGGGQPNDKVTVFLPGSSDPLPVQKITSIHDFTLKLPKKFALQPPFIITLKLDLPFRHAIMRAHTCQHLLSALILKKYSIKTLKAVMQADQGQLVLDKPFPLESLSEISLNMNEFISVKPVSVTSHVLEAGSSIDQDGQPVDLSKIRGSVPKEAPFVRVLAIGPDVDLNTCGGTHISSTDQLMSFFITSHKKSELSFICGLKGLSFLAEHNQSLLQSSLSINQPFESTLSYLSNQFSSLSKQQLDSSSLTVNLLRTFFASLQQNLNPLDPALPGSNYSSSSFKDTFTWHIWFHKSITFLLLECPIDKKLGSEALKIFSDFDQNFITFLLASQDTLLINVSHPSSSPLTARGIADKFKAIYPTSKGGGNDFFAQLLLKDIGHLFSTIEEDIKGLFA